MTFWAISFKILVAGVKLHVYGSTQSPKGQMTVGVPLFGACYLRGFTVQRARVPRVHCPFTGSMLVSMHCSAR